MSRGVVVNRYAPTFRNIIIEVRGEYDLYPSFIARYEGLPINDELELTHHFATALQLRIRNWLLRNPNHSGRGMLTIRNPGLAIFDAYGDANSTQEILIYYNEITSGKLLGMLEKILMSNAEATFNTLIVEFNVFDEGGRYVYGIKRGEIMLKEESFKSMFVPETIVNLIFNFLRRMYFLLKKMEIKYQ